MNTEPTHHLGTSPTAADAIQAQLLLDRCHDLITDQDYRGAAAAQQATDLVPNQPDPYVTTAEAMIGIGSHEHAVDAYDEAYQRTQPDKRYEILKGPGYNKHCIADHIGAIEDLTEIIALQPDNPSATPGTASPGHRSPITKAPWTTSTKPPKSGDRPARGVHFLSALYTRLNALNSIYAIFSQLARLIVCARCRSALRLEKRN